MKKYFLTGLAILLPLALTLVIVLFLFNLLTTPFLGVVSGLMKHFHLLQHGWWIFSGDQMEVFISRLLILFSLFLFTVLLGILTRWYVLHVFIRSGEYLLDRIPVIRNLYTTFKDLVHTIFTSDASGFKQVVMIPFPHQDSYTIGLVTKEDIVAEDGLLRTAVFVPTTPNPTSGYLLLVKHEDITYLDLDVEEALKYIISCGVVLVPFRKISRDDAKKRLLDQFREASEI